MDLPDERRVHSTPIPRAGGLAVWLTFMAVAFTVCALGPLELREVRQDWLIPFAAASGLLVVVGILDDRGGIKPWWKLLGQIVAAGVFFALRPGSQGNMLGISLPMWVDGAIFIGWAVLLINAFNLIDGLDGLCGGLALISMVSLGIMAAVNDHLAVMVLMFIMAAAVMGFLRFNWNPARIFLGDTGSMLLGFFIAAAATQTTGRRAIVGTILLPIAVAGVPLLDVLLAVWRRSVRNLMSQWSGGEAVGVFAPDKDHLHHRFLAKGDGQKKVTRLLHKLALVLSFIAFLPMMFGDEVIGISIIGLLVLAVIGIRNFARIELVQSGSALHLALKRPSGNRRMRAAAFFYDCVMLALCALFAIWLEGDLSRRGMSQLETVQFTVIFVVLGIAGLYLSKVYRRVWSRATLRDLAGVAACLGASGVMCATLFFYMQSDISFEAARISLMATCLAMLTVPLPRCSVELLRELAVDAGHRRFEKKGTHERHVVVYGAGDLGNLFIDYLKTCPPSHFKNFRVVGFVDENPTLKRRIMRGFPVLGDLSVLDELAGQKQLHGVIVAISNPSPERLAGLREIAERQSLNVYSWCFDLTPEVMEINRPAQQTVGAAAKSTASATDLEMAR